MGFPPGTLRQSRPTRQQRAATVQVVQEETRLKEPWPGNSEGVQVVFKAAPGHLLSAYSMPSPILRNMKDVSIRFNLHLQ